MLPSTPTPFEAHAPRPFARAAQRRPAQGKWSPADDRDVSPQSPSRWFCLRTAAPGAWSSCLYMPRGRGGGFGRAELTWGGGSAPAARSSTTPPSGPRTAASLRCRRHRSNWARGGAVQLIVLGEKGIGGGGGGNVPAAGVPRPAAPANSASAPSPKLPQWLSTAPERLCSALFCAPSALRPPGGPQTLTLLPPAGPSTPQPLLAVLRCASAPAKHGAAEDCWPVLPVDLEERRRSSVLPVLRLLGLVSWALLRS